MRTSQADSIVRVLGAVGRARIKHQNETGAELRSGSMMAYRLLGRLTPSGWMPMRLRIYAVPVGEGLTRVTVLASSEQGWYAMQISSLARPIYDRTFESVFQSVRAALAPIAAG